MRPIPLLVLVFLGWCFVSWNWYVCRIKGICDKKEKAIKTVVVPDIANEEVTKPVDGNLVFNVNSSNPITNEQTIKLFSDLKAGLGDNDKIIISGGYYGNEVNNTSFDNLGLSRAEKVKELLSKYVDSNVLETQGNLLGQNAPSNDLLLRGTIDFGKESIETATKDEFKVTEFADKLIINFPTASARPKDNASLSGKLQTLAKKIQQGKIKTVIEGHTDNSGTSEANIWYGQQRADVIKSTLEGYGVDSSLLSAVSKGEMNPIASNTTKEGKAKNRRVEILLNN